MHKTIYFFDMLLTCFSFPSLFFSLLTVENKSMHNQVVYNLTSLTHILAFFFIFLFTFSNYSSLLFLLYFLWYSLFKKSLLYFYFFHYYEKHLSKRKLFDWIDLPYYFLMLKVGLDKKLNFLAFSHFFKTNSIFRYKVKIIL